METLTRLFDRMDSWRHFPNYQLERRADLFFSLYLSEVLEAKLGFPIVDEIVPEFPVRIGTIYPDRPTDKSVKIDYLAMSEDGRTAIFVELKTEGKSRRKTQDKYLRESKNAGLSALLDGLLEIFRATNAKRKYFCLLRQLEVMGLLAIPGRMHDQMGKDSIQGATELSREIEITCPATNSRIVYVQPHLRPEDVGKTVVTFKGFRAVVLKHDDLLSSRFAESLSKWGAVEAGRPW